MKIRVSDLATMVVTLVAIAVAAPVEDVSLLQLLNQRDFYRVNSLRYRSNTSRVLSIILR